MEHRIEPVHFLSQKYKETWAGATAKDKTLEILEKYKDNIDYLRKDSGIYSAMNKVNDNR